MSEKVSIIIVNMNGGEMILDCLGSLYSQESRPDRIIVVDNGSRDGSDDLVEEAFPEAVLLRQKENTGFARGNNIGLCEAVGDLVALVNNDCIAEPGWLASLRDTMTDDSIGAVSSSMRNISDINVMDSAGVAVDWLGFSWDRGRGESASVHSTRNDVISPCGGAVMIRRSALPDTNRLFNEDLFIYLEDVELGYQLNRLGKRVVYDPGAVIRHVHSATAGRGSYVQEFFCNRNRLLILRRQLRTEILRRMMPAILGWQVMWTAASFARGRFTLARALWNATLEGLRKPVDYQEAGKPLEEVFRDFAVMRKGRPWTCFQKSARKAMYS